MRCKYTKLFQEICSVLQISCASEKNLQCIANFLSVKLITLSVICISENLYLFSFIARYIL